MSEEKNKFIALYHFLDKPQDFNLEMNYYEFRDDLKNLLDLYQKEKEKNKKAINRIKYYFDTGGSVTIALNDVKELLEERN